MLTALLRSSAQLAGIVLFRFPPLVRAWAVLLLTLNAFALLFIRTVYGQVALGCVGAGVLVMVAIHRRVGFVRLLGIGHIFWIPMIVWLVRELPSVDREGFLFYWLVCLIACNSISLVVDTIDVTRYALGERSPHYSWD